MMRFPCALAATAMLAGCGAPATPEQALERQLMQTMVRKEADLLRATTRLNPDGTFTSELFFRGGRDEKGEIRYTCDGRYSRDSDGTPRPGAHGCRQG